MLYPTELHPRKDLPDAAFPGVSFGATCTALPADVLCDSRVAPSDPLHGPTAQPSMQGNTKFRLRLQPVFSDYGPHFASCA